MTFNVLDVVPKDCPDWDLLDHRQRMKYTGWVQITQTNKISPGIVYRCYKNGDLHREDGPAEMQVDFNGNLRFLRYFYKDQIVGIFLCGVEKDRTEIRPKWPSTHLLDHLPSNSTILASIRNTEKLKVILDF